jgi:tetratricopeptide (TPR) repeat protein
MQLDSSNRTEFAMENDRIEFLHHALAANPDDAFAHYALALELANRGQNEEAWQHFEYLLTHHPDYAPAYYQAGMLLLRQGRREAAGKAFAKGIELTGREGNTHAQKQLQAVLDMLQSHG